MPSPTQLRIINQLINSLTAVHEKLLEREPWIENQLDAVHPNFQYSAKNLLRYLMLRGFDLRDIQSQLTNLGLSSLSHAERQVLANVENILYLLHAQLGEKFEGKYPFGEHPVNYAESAKKLQDNTKRLFGEQLDGVGVMVTLPSQAVEANYMEMLLRNGMEIARINCSHDDQATWNQMIKQLRLVGKAIDKPCQVYMDLSGPKIRTKDFKVPRGVKGKKKFFIVNEGDELLLVKDFRPRNQKVPMITCTLPSIIDDVKAGHHIWFDDGKFGGVIDECFDQGVRIIITHAGPNGEKFKREKGINLPDTQLNLPSLTASDIENLDFICENADIVGYSFVRNASDVDHLQKELKKRNRDDLGIVLKIENREAFANLPSLLLKAMESPTIGIMTARGDLAVELGAERLSEVQEQIMWICEAAMVPSIWATQVLESLAKKGVASRAEVTDAAMSVRAECVMLNKGPYIHKALQTLNDILFRMEQHQFKKQATLGKLKVAEEFWSHQLV